MMDNLINTEINAQRIATVESCFGTSGQPLAMPGRVLVGEGVLTKECRKKPKPRIFFLFSDILVYGNIVISKIRYNSQHIIPLEDVTIEVLPDAENMRNRWMIKTSKKSFVVSAASHTERNEWIGHINECIGQILEKTGRKPPNAHAPAWIPDTATDICMRCTQTKFTALTRRHHCRQCGFVVCQECSKYKFLLPDIASKPQRVCLLCYKKLTSKNLSHGDEDRKSFSHQFHSQVPQYDPSSEDESEEEEKTQGWPSSKDFCGESWYDFHA
ncbi:pleckstrin homology domain-containing family F member 1 [Spea bombifrons]|uniref:pleckstrin homology domain-containing family F member 1 n=1 Tax=Spea bombifrons TaxID=233779 RepID=UPI002349656C|nr:pleckstrin homology domain-containing family F member 1 [Spea bombifrons]